MEPYNLDLKDGHLPLILPFKVYTPYTEEWSLSDYYKRYISYKVQFFESQGNFPSLVVT